MRSDTKSGSAGKTFNDATKWCGKAVGLPDPRNRAVSMDSLDPVSVLLGLFQSMGH